jgi:hypothetical protein
VRAAERGMWLNPEPEEPTERALGEPVLGPIADAPTSMVELDRARRKATLTLARLHLPLILIVVALGAVLVFVKGVLSWPTSAQVGGVCKTVIIITGILSIVGLAGWGLWLYTRLLKDYR